MKLFEGLKKEFYEFPDVKRAHDGIAYSIGYNSPNAQNYFRYQGYKKDFSAPISILRAEGIAALFTLPEPKIFVHDLIVGNAHGLFMDVDEVEQAEADAFALELGRRSFRTNSDHYAPNYDHVIARGIGGMIEDIDASLEKYAADAKKCETLKAMRITLVAFREMMAGYLAKAEDLLDNEAYDKDRLQFIIENCKVLCTDTGAPQSFAQALQLVWFCDVAFYMEGRRAMALGRMDQYLYPLYQKDMEAGRLSHEEAVELLENVFTKIHNKNVVNICIGGMNKEHQCMVNGLSYDIVEAVKECNAPGPNLSLRYTADTPEDFMIACLKSIGTGLGYPAIMNDEVNIAALRKYGYEEEDLCNYCMVGCIENFITGMQPPWSDGRFDTPRYLDYVFFNGRSDFNKSTGLKLGEAEEITSMEAFMDHYEKQIAFGVSKYCATFEARNNSINQEYFAEPFLSCFCYDCIGRGMDINNGGAKYPSVHGAGVMGVATVVDSLAAIEKVVFVDKEATLAEVRDALKADFEGYEDLQEKLLAAPKYGNNDEFADKYARWYPKFLGEEFRKYKTRDGGGYYIAMAANVQNVSAGKETGATPDGRKAGEPLSDAASPTYGRDTKGATVTLNSLSKPDYTMCACGSVVNQKYSPSMFEGEKCKKLLALIRTYMKKGGQEIQINATSRAILLDAMEHPEKYQNLVVRVSGFSDYYVRLRREVQLDILNRTQQE